MNVPESLNQKMFFFHVVLCREDYVLIPGGTGGTDPTSLPRDRFCGQVLFFIKFKIKLVKLNLDLSVKFEAL